MEDILAPRYIDPVAARKHLEAIRWPDGPVCPHCGSFDVTRLEGAKHRDGLIQCNEKECRQQFTVTVGTVFERSKIALNKWLLCNHLLVSSKKGMSAHQIHRMLGVTYKTAWFMCHRLREAMKPAGGEPPLGGFTKFVEADEMFVGGSQTNRAYRAVAPKMVVVSLVERGGQARSFHVANVNAKTVRALIVTNVDRKSHLMTDESKVYTRVGREFSTHHSVDHRFEYARPGGFHSNTVENFFSIFKRGVIGTYHHMSEAHLHRYTAEFDFRYNTKDISDHERADLSLQGISGKRLTYRRTDRLAA
jgi:transposase-like protein